MSSPGSIALLTRALRRRCPHCGVGKVYEGFSQLEKCSHCHFRFNREYGYFLGALIVAYAVLGGTALTAMLILASLGAHPAIALGLPLGIGTIALPFFIPLSRTLWMAIDLRCSPPEPGDFAPPAAKNAEEENKP